MVCVKDERIEEIEERKSTYMDPFYTSKVEFLHRTVHDFLHTNEMQRMLIDNLEAGFEPKLRLCKALAAQLKVLDYRALEGSAMLPTDLLEDLAYYANRLESETHVSPISLLSDVGRNVSRQATFFGWKNGEKYYLEFLAQRRLHLYITHTLTSDTSLSQSDKSTLLVSVLSPSVTRHFPTKCDMKMISILLKYGARPDSKYGDSTVWGHFLQNSEMLGRASYEDVPSIIETLLAHGANLRQRIMTREKTQSRILLSRASDLHSRQESQSNMDKSAQQILVMRYGEDRVSEMLKNAGRNQKSIPQRLQWWAERSVRIKMVSRNECKSLISLQ